MYIICIGPLGRMELAPSHSVLRRAVSKLFKIIFILCVSVCVRARTCRVQKTTWGIPSLLPPCGFQVLNSFIIRLGDKYLYLLVGPVSLNS